MQKQIQIQIQIRINEVLGKAPKGASSRKIHMLPTLIDDIDEPLNDPIDDEGCEVLG